MTDMGIGLGWGCTPTGVTVRLATLVIMAIVVDLRYSFFHWESVMREYWRLGSAA
jgi:hypothetical protein